MTSSSNITDLHHNQHPHANGDTNGNENTMESSVITSTSLFSVNEDDVIDAADGLLLGQLLDGSLSNSSTRSEEEDCSVERNSNSQTQHQDSSFRVIQFPHQKLSYSNYPDTLTAREADPGKDDIRDAAIRNLSLSLSVVSTLTHPSYEGGNIDEVTTAIQPHEHEEPTKTRQRMTRTHPHTRRWTLVVPCTRIRNVSASIIVVLVCLFLITSLLRLVGQMPLKVEHLESRFLMTKEDTIVQPRTVPQRVFMFDHARAHAHSHDHEQNTDPSKADHRKPRSRRRALHLESKDDETRLLYLPGDGRCHATAEEDSPGPELGFIIAKYFLDCPLRYLSGEWSPPPIKCNGLVAFYGGRPELAVPRLLPTSLNHLNWSTIRKSLEQGLVREVKQLVHNLKKAATLLGVALRTELNSIWKHPEWLFWTHKWKMPFTGFNAGPQTTDRVDF
jgi:hypothetical protein